MPSPSPAPASSSPPPSIPVAGVAPGLGDLVRGGCEQGARVDVGAVLEALDQVGAGVLAPRPDLDAFGRRRLLESGLRETGEELLGRHVRQEELRVDRIAGDARDDAAVRHVVAARQRDLQHRAGGLAHRVLVGREHPALDQPAGKSLTAGASALRRALDRYVLAAEGQNEQRQQRAVIDIAFPQGLVKRVGAQIADDGVALLGDVRPGFRLRCLGLRRPTTLAGLGRALVRLAPGRRSS